MQMLAQSNFARHNLFTTETLNPNPKTYLTSALQVDDYLRVEGRTNWFAIGDITSLPDRKMGHNAHHHGEHVAKSIKASQAGSAALQKVTLNPKH